MEHICRMQSMGQVWKAEPIGRHRVESAKKVQKKMEHIWRLKVTEHTETYPDLDELLLLLLLLDEEEDEEELLDDEEEEVPSRLSALCSSSSARSARSGL